MRILFLVLMVCAAAGLVLSTAVHVLLLAGIPPGDALVWGLRLAIFPLFLPALVIHTRLTGGSKKMTDQDSWALLFAGCPAWMRRMLRGLYIYAAVNFAIVCVVVILSLAGIEIGADSRAVAWTDGWGVFMWLYGACLAIFTGAYRRGIAGVKRTPPAARHGS